MVRTAYRGLVAGALGLPLMFGAPSVALASDYDSSGSGDHRSDGRKGDEAHFVWIDELKKWVKTYEDNRETEQEQTNETEQANENATTVYQISFGNKGDTAVNTSSEQENEAEAGQEQAVDQSTNVQPANGGTNEAQSQESQAPNKESQSQESQAQSQESQGQESQGAQAMPAAQESQESQAQESQSVQAMPAAQESQSGQNAQASESAKVK